MKKAIITGGTRGIGASCVEKFAKNGYDVAFFFKESENKAIALKEKFQNVYPIKCDVSSESEVVYSISKAIEIIGDPDVLVNNAGICYSGLLQDMKLDDWENVIKTNLTSMFLCCREVIPSMVRRKSGSIINVSSVWGIQGASCEVAYSTSKAGIIGFTKALAMELAPSFIRVNSVAPGVIKTDMLNCYTEEELAELSKDTPLGRLGAPDDVSNAVFFLADDSSNFITGEVLNISGGFVI